MAMKTFRIAISVLLIALAIDGAFGADRPARFEKPDDVVAWLYRDFGWEALISVYFRGDSLIDQPYGVLSRYFTSELSQLLVQTRKREVNNQEPGPIDFVLIFGSQDTDGIVNIRIARRSKDNVVTVIYDQNTERDVREIQFDTVNSPGGWRISNIRYHSKEAEMSSEKPFSLLDLLGKKNK